MVHLVRLKDSQFDICKSIKQQILHFYNLLHLSASTNNQLNILSNDESSKLIDTIKS